MVPNTCESWLPVQTLLAKQGRHCCNGMLGLGRGLNKAGANTPLIKLDLTIKALACRVWSQSVSVISTGDLDTPSQACRIWQCQSLALWIMILYLSHDWWSYSHKSLSLCIPAPGLQPPLQANTDKPERSFKSSIHKRCPLPSLSQVWWTWPCGLYGAFHWEYHADSNPKSSRF